MVQLDSVVKNFQQGTKTIEVLKNINWKIDQPGAYGLIGQSGSGKSTLLSLLSGLDNPTSGKVLISNQNLEELDERELSLFRGENIGVVFQQFHLIDYMTALENVMLPLRILKHNNIEEMAKSYLEKVGLQDRMNHLPSQLSGGEKQRVAIARAIVIKPRLLLADEPSGSLDPSTGEKILKLLLDLIAEEKILALLVTHQTELAEECKEVFALSNGVIVKRG